MNLIADKSSPQKKVLITGALGQDGANMAEYLCNTTNHMVYGMMRRSANPNFKNISETFKNNLSSMENKVQDFKKFVYYDGTNYNYVRLANSISFVEVAHQRYSASIKLREQLS